MWEYPPRGRIIASCGHEVFGDDRGEFLGQRARDYEPGIGEYECEIWGCYCPPCALRLKTSGFLVMETTDD